MTNLKKVKLTNKIKSLAPKFKWVFFTEMQDFKLTSDYIDFICPDPKKEANQTKMLDKMIRETLIKEFSPEIVNSDSFELLVDAVAHKMKKDSLKD